MSKGTDLATALSTVQSEIGHLSAFLTTKVRPLFSQGASAFENALHDVVTPDGGKGLKDILTFIDDKVEFIKNTMKMT